jgi:hypothetical protein
MTLKMVQRVDLDQFILLVGYDTTKFSAQLFIEMFVLLACLTAVDQYSYGLLQMTPTAETTDRFSLFEKSRGPRRGDRNDG